MFGHKLATATAQVTALLAALKGIGFEAATAEAVTPAALQSHLAARENAAAEAATAPLAAEIASLKAANETLRSGLAAAGVVVPAAEGTADGVKKAVEAKIAAVAQTKAVETIASSGHIAALAVPPGGDGTTPSAQDVPASAEDFLAAHAAIPDPAKRAAYYRKHAHRFPVR